MASYELDTHCTSWPFFDDRWLLHFCLNTMENTIPAYETNGKKAGERHALSWAFNPEYVLLNGCHSVFSLLRSAFYLDNVLLGWHGWLWELQFKGQIFDYSCGECIHSKIDRGGIPTISYGAFGYSV